LIYTPQLTAIRFGIRVSRLELVAGCVDSVRYASPLVIELFQKSLRNYLPLIWSAASLHSSISRSKNRGCCRGLGGVKFCLIRRALEGVDLEAGSA
jgi:hypothetical protein